MKRFWFPLAAVAAEFWMQLHPAPEWVHWTVIIAGLAVGGYALLGMLPDYGAPTPPDPSKES
jgi:hypothetical protein